MNQDDIIKKITNLINDLKKCNTIEIYNYINGYIDACIDSKILNHNKEYYNLISELEKIYNSSII